MYSVQSTTVQKQCSQQFTYFIMFLLIIPAVNSAYIIQKQDINISLFIKSIVQGELTAKLYVSLYLKTK